MDDVSPNPDLLTLTPTVSRVLAHVCCCMFHNSTEKVKSKAYETNKNPQRMSLSMMPGFSMYKHIFKHHGHFPQMDDELLLSKSIQWFLYSKTEQADGT